jgi:hypothetical protein
MDENNFRQVNKKSITCVCDAFKVLKFLSVQPPFPYVLCGSFLRVTRGRDRREHKITESLRREVIRWLH